MLRGNEHYAPLVDHLTVLGLEGESFVDVLVRLNVLPAHRLLILKAMMNGSLGLSDHRQLFDHPATTNIPKSLKDLLGQIEVSAESKDDDSVTAQPTTPNRRAMQLLLGGAAALKAATPSSRELPPVVLTDQSAALSDRLNSREIPPRPLNSTPPTGSQRRLVDGPDGAPMPPSMPPASASGPQTKVPFEDRSTPFPGRVITDSYSARVLKKLQEAKQSSNPPSAEHQSSPQAILGKPDHYVPHLVEVSGLIRPMAPGDLIGQCRLVMPLGRGSSASVWKAWHETLRINVALKLLNRDAKGEFFSDRFLAEARLVASINHANILRVYDCGDHGDHRYIVAELVEGVSLGEVLRVHRRISRKAALEAIILTALALKYAFTKKGLIHRDVKPDNIMVTTDGEVKLTDFGLAESVNAPTDSNRHRKVSGSPAYMAPELISAHHEPSMAQDVYALGISLYQLIVGSLPYNASTMTETMRLHAEAPIPVLSSTDPAARTIDPILTRMLAKNPADRYTEYREMVMNMYALLSEFYQTNPFDSLSGDICSLELADLASTTRQKMNTATRPIVD